jgi:hypothetical protein
MQGLQDEDDNTETREIRDNRILQLQDEDNNYYGDGGTSDAEGIGFDDVQGFRDDMMEANLDRLNNGKEDVKDGILDTEQNATQCLVTNDRRGKQVSSLYGAPAGWTPPSPEDGWAPKKVNTTKGEVPFEEVDNPGCWSSYTFQPVFQNNKKTTGKDSTNEVKMDETSPSEAKGKGKGGQYLHHAMPCGARPIPIDDNTGKREAGGWEFYYEDWKHPNPTNENCRIGSDKDTVFPEGREVQLDGDYLKMMGLTKKRMEECDALFFYQLLVPIGHPSFSGLPNVPRMGYYEEVANCTNEYASGYKRRSGTYGNKFSPVNAEELVVWDGIVIRNLSDNIADCWLKNQSNTYDREIDEAMRFRRWLDIKSVMKQNVYHREKKGGGGI